MGILLLLKVKRFRIYRLFARRCWGPRMPSSKKKRVCKKTAIDHSLCAATTSRAESCKAQTACLKAFPAPKAALIDCDESRAMRYASCLLSSCSHSCSPSTVSLVLEPQAPLTWLADAGWKSELNPLRMRSTKGISIKPSGATRDLLQSTTSGPSLLYGLDEERESGTLFTISPRNYATP